MRNVLGHFSYCQYQAKRLPFIFQAPLRTPFAGATDRLVRIFDCSLIGAEQSPDEAEEGPPEIIFVHGGHVAGITELDWNPLDDEFPWVSFRAARFQLA